MYSFRPPVREAWNGCHITRDLIMLPLMWLHRRPRPLVYGLFAVTKQPAQFGIPITPPDANLWTLGADFFSDLDISSRSAIFDELTVSMPVLSPFAPGWLLTPLCAAFAWSFIGRPVVVRTRVASFARRDTHKQGRGIPRPFVFCPSRKEAACYFFDGNGGYVGGLSSTISYPSVSFFSHSLGFIRHDYITCLPGGAARLRRSSAALCPLFDDVVAFVGQPVCRNAARIRSLRKPDF
ncbi:hypothetical protein FQR65_LT20596 [Abscondita terminalis]|nr:hypothetical protein FQR65_LT20596 [Abscondita terminalis]